MKIATHPDIDWDGNCKFDESGAVVEFVKHKVSNHMRMLPIPRDDETLQEARSADLALKAIMQPATREQIAVCIKKLSLHCGMQAKAPEDVKYLFLDYCVDLAQYPVRLIEEACQKYRSSAEGNSFMPGSGKLIALIEPKFRKMKLLRTRIDKILGVHVEPAQKENKTLSLDEALARLA